MKILFISILTLLVFSGCTDEKISDKNQQSKENTTQKKIKETIVKKDDGIVLTDTAGTQIKVKKLETGFVFEGFENKVVLINFFATWCPPCKAEIPHLNNLQNKYPNDLKIISVLLEGSKSNEEVIEFINDNDIEFTIVNSQENFELAKKVGGVQSIPYMIIYDKKGNYFQHYTGAILEEMIEADVKKVL